MKKIGKRVRPFTVILLLAVFAAGCGRNTKENLLDDNVLSDNIVITETGEVLTKKAETKEPDSELEQGLKQDEEAKEQRQNAVIQVQAEDGSIQEIELLEPEQEQVITGEDQIAPGDGNLQLVFLGDSIFDNNRDGSGIPYLTAQQCDADVYNLAIGGTRATIERDESAENAKWTSSSLCGIVKAMRKEIPTDVFAGKRAKELLDNPDIHYENTDYFIVEYGTNDFFGAAPLNGENMYDVRTYVGALRYAVSNLKELAPDATIILCSPCYAQFYNGNWMIGDGNVTNTGYGTLFDYKGVCEYAANETNSLFFNAYQDLGIDSYTAEEYLEDGVHLSEAGRRLYADALAKMILSYEETKNN